jgi:hypothetical protein
LCNRKNTNNPASRATHHEFYLPQFFIGSKFGELKRPHLC